MEKFLDGYKTTDSDIASHLSVRKEYLGKFYIPDEQLEKFYKIYNNELKNGYQYILERPYNNQSPIKIDIDLKSLQLPKNKKRLYSNDCILNFIKLYLKNLVKIIDIYHDFRVIIMEKDEPSYTKNKYYKDGFHIIIPELVCNNDVLLYVRQVCLDNDIISKSFNLELTYTNSDEDIFDKAVIKSNSWPLLGSVGGSDGKQPYKITKIIRFDKDINPLEIIKDDLNKIKPQDLSIRNREINTDVRPEFQNKIIKIIDEEKPPEYKERIDLTKVRALLEIINPNRAIANDTWTQVGWCLYNIDPIELYDDFIKFSQKSSNFDKQGCDTFWKYAKQKSNGFTIKSLYFWAKNDNPEAYLKLTTQKVSDLKTGDIDIARIVFDMYGHQYIHTWHFNKNKHGWYKFDKNSWYYRPDGHDIVLICINELPKIYNNYIEENTHKMLSPALTNGEKTAIVANIKEANKIITQLSKMKFVKEVRSASEHLCRDFDFHNKLDRNPYLLGFKDGIYDLQNGNFREGMPQDYVSKSCGIEFPYETNPEYDAQLLKFLEEILPNPEVREYILTVFASTLDYVNREEKFYIITGNGRNGKSLLTQLHQDFMKDYSCNIPVALITQKRAESNKASPEVAKLELIRFALIKEPDLTDKTINTGLIKELTGNDIISARNLFENDKEFRVSSKLMYMVNALPDIFTDDTGIWDRIKVIDFPIRFCEPNQIKNPEIEKPIDNQLKQKIKFWLPSWAKLLIKIYYPKYIKMKNIPEPKSITDATKNYRERNNIILDFLNKTTEQGNNKSSILLNTLFDQYTLWFNEWHSGSGKRVITKKEFEGCMKSHFGNSFDKNKIKGWNLKVNVEIENSDKDM